MEDRELSQQNEKRMKISVEIYGQQYSVVGDESTSHMRMVAAIVDDKMREINAKNPSLDINRLAVLTAVNVVHDYIKLKEETERLKERIKGMNEE
ncbi:cell division protein ZapA [Ectobacillus sp. sgz5001026]|uniref:cell division protein ZapA n=1 Tax=Ectobacillus sp. sgz5001026 TaxID=3242473 RepID=UPI0036D3BDEC